MAVISRRDLIAGFSSFGASIAIKDDDQFSHDMNERDYTKDILAVDCYSYPGNTALDFLKNDHNAKIICFYLSHSRNRLDNTWSKSSYSYARDKGWGFLPTYNGAQDVRGREQRAAQRDAMQAVELLKKVGFPEGTICYLDVEDFHPASAEYWTYFKTWCLEVRKLNFYPGVYTVYTNIPLVSALTNALWIAEAPYSPSRFYRKGGKLDLALQKGLSLKEAYRAGLIPYDAEKYPHGRMFKGAIAVQYAFHQFPLASRGNNTEFDYSASIANDPSSAQAVAAALGVDALI